jgi:hypothetical protein
LPQVFGRSDEVRARVHKLASKRQRTSHSCTRPMPVRTPPVRVRELLPGTTRSRAASAGFLCYLASEERPPPGTRPRQRGGSAGLPRRSERPPQNQQPITTKTYVTKRCSSPNSRGWWRGRPLGSAYDAIAGPDAGRCHPRSRRGPAEQNPGGRRKAGTLA